MALKTELIAGIRILSKMHRVSAVRFLSPNADMEPGELVKLHILFRDDLNTVLHGLGIDCYKGGIGPSGPLRRNDRLLYVLADVPPPQSPGEVGNWYRRFIEYYRKVIDIGPLPPHIENTLLRQLSAMGSLLCNLEPVGPGHTAHCADLGPPSQRAHKGPGKTCRSPFYDCNEYAQGTSDICEGCKNDLDHLHDAIFDSVGVSYTMGELSRIYAGMPRGLKHLANEWGMGDTVFRDRVLDHAAQLKV